MKCVIGAVLDYLCRNDVHGIFLYRLHPSFSERIPPFPMSFERTNRSVSLESKTFVFQRVFERYVCELPLSDAQISTISATIRSKVARVCYSPTTR